ncbi:MAG: hypothetical protein AAFQ09_10930, partial [Pseudomonadota bacterium]
GQSLPSVDKSIVPEPPGPVLVIRSSLRHRDLRFFTEKSRPFRDDYNTAKDAAPCDAEDILLMNTDQFKRELAMLAQFGTSESRVAFAARALDCRAMLMKETAI